jgi:phosphoribosylanthranilate isomerase
MSVFVKICGLTTAEALDAAVETGADAVGLWPRRSR